MSFLVRKYRTNPVYRSDNSVSSRWVRNLRAKHPRFALTIRSPLDLLTAMLRTKLRTRYSTSVYSHIFENRSVVRLRSAHTASAKALHSSCNWVVDLQSLKPGTTHDCVKHCKKPGIIENSGVIENSLSKICFGRSVSRVSHVLVGSSTLPHPINNSA